MRIGGTPRCARGDEMLLDGIAATYCIEAPSRAASSPLARSIPQSFGICLTKFVRPQTTSVEISIPDWFPRAGGECFSWLQVEKVHRRGYDFRFQSPGGRNLSMSDFLNFCRFDDPHNEIHVDRLTNDSNSHSEFTRSPAARMIARKSLLQMFPATYSEHSKTAKSL